MNICSGVRLCVCARMSTSVCVYDGVNASANVCVCVCKVFLCRIMSHYRVIIAPLLFTTPLGLFMLISILHLIAGAWRILRRQKQSGCVTHPS